MKYNNLLYLILKDENLGNALGRVLDNKGAPGIDGMTVEQLPQYFLTNLPQIKDSIINGSYNPKPVKGVEIPKDNGTNCLLYTSPSPRDLSTSRMPSSA